MKDNIHTVPGGFISAGTALAPHRNHTGRPLKQDRSGKAIFRKNVFRFCVHFHFSIRFHFSNTVFCYSRNINIFRNILSQRTAFSGGQNVNSRNSFFRIDSAAQRSAAVDYGKKNFFIRYSRFKTVNRRTSGDFLNFIHNGRFSASAGHMINLFRFSSGFRIRGPP